MPDLINIPLPVKGNYFIPSGGGYGAGRARQAGNATATHEGIDLAVNKNTPIFAPLPGRVVILSTTARGGIQMRLVHNDGYTTGYAHLSSIVVLNGAQVEANTIIAYSGDTGDAIGHPHLHFTVLKDGVHVDPYPYLFGADNSVQQNKSIQYTPESTTTPKQKDYSQIIVVDSPYINTLSAFIAKYNITLTPAELLNYKDNATNIIAAY